LYNPWMFPSHDRMQRIDGRYEAAHGKMAAAKNDFDHAHALKKDAHYDAESRRQFGGHIHGLYKR